MPLTDRECRNSSPREKLYKLSDGGGLHLRVFPNGAKYWNMKYRFGDKERLIAFGVYPAVSLASARKKREEAKKLIAENVDPSDNRKSVKASRIERSANSFEVIGREWHNKFKPKWSDEHGRKILARLEKDVFPWLGGKPVAEIKSSDLRTTIQRIEKRGALETAHRALQNCGQILRYAITTDRAEIDVSQTLKGWLPPVKNGHFAAITEPMKVGELLRTVDGYHGSHIVRAALLLAPMVFVRPLELRSAKWADIDFETAEWRYFVSKTKTDHIVPLSTQAIAILRDLHDLTGNGEYVFPGRSATRCMSENAILTAFRSMGIPKEEMTGHGFRAMFRTIGDEVLGFEIHLIEHQLAHSVRDTLGRAYNRTSHLPQRKAMMQQWADYLDKLRSGAEIIPIRA